MCEDSPIEKEQSAGSLDYNTSDDVIQDDKHKAGMSDEVNTLNLTPPTEFSPDTYERRLALHASDIVSASMTNPNIPELHENEGRHIVIVNNTFARRGVAEPVKLHEIFGHKPDGVSTTNSTDGESRPGGMEGMNSGPSEASNDVSEGVSRSVGMDGMNKSRNGGRSRPVGMDGMNKSPEREGFKGSQLVEEKDCGALEGRRIASVGRRHTLASGEDARRNRKLNNIVFQFGKGASGEVLKSRACPLSQSPKRAMQMEIDVSTPIKKKRRERCQSTRIGSGQRLLTEVWNKRKEEGEKTSH